jgi:hypothetical protein
MFATEEIEKRQKVIAVEIVRALFDRREALEIPEEDDDLVTREAASMFATFFAKE